MKTVTYSDEQIQRLIDGGWKETSEKSGMWLREGMNPRLGGYSTGEALRKQDQLDVINKYGAYYYVQSDRNGFGYWLGAYYKENPEKPRRTSFDHLTEEDAKKLQKRFNSEANYEPILGIDYKPQDFAMIVVFKEKHGDRHFIVKNQTELNKVALKIVLEREEEGWYDFDYEKPVEPKMTVEDAAKLGMAGVKDAVEREWSSYKYSKKQYEEGIQLKAALEKVVKEKDGATAFRFLNEMKGGEYEAFEVISSESLE